MNGILLERAKQIEHGYDADHDSEFVEGELLQVALCYLQGDGREYPWDDAPDFAALSYEERLRKGGAMIMAELDRVERAR